ncbi:conserved hypothetical protein [Chloroherpeton thalassium ATCC 35110]|uniref:SbsA Ig-like domain-containing protein n=1 Tax=Chloroherpeton thalassium (strain ATCC 35110 / GB-78) TaxID=517418 RepID=B3QST2_CHLT3|nr:conserved hypothetical protein [Chloroherpeton thalassium ATCC 35110]
MRVVLLILALSWFVLSCASQRAPTGGPEDKTPPHVVRTEPDSAAIRFSGNHLRLYFDKYMSRSTLASALFFSPAITDYEIEWDGYKEVDIILYDTLKDNRTYTVTITNSLQDTRGNKLPKSYTFAFSTGEVVDSGGISGRVFTELSRPASGALVMAYLLPEPASGIPDTLNPSKVVPDYIAQTDAAGDFSLRYLAIGRYRIVAITDKNQNMLYDLGTEPFAVPTDSLIQTGMSNLKLRFAQEDTTAVELQSVTPVTSNQIAVKFNRKLVSKDAAASNFSLFDSTALAPVRVYDFSIEYQSDWQYFYLSIDSLIADHYYELSVNGPHDEFGNVAKNQKVPFFGVQEPDSLKALFQIPFMDSTSGLLYNDLPTADGKTLSLAFSRPVSRTSLKQALSLYKLIDTSYAPIESKLIFQDAKSFKLKPAEEFELGAWYKLVLAHGKVRDALGRPTIDTTYQLRFQIAGLDRFGGIEGRVQSKKLGKIIISAWPLGKSYNYRTMVENTIGSAAFEFPVLPEGMYTLSAFQAENRTAATTAYAAWDGGKAFPTKPAENFTIGKDTVRVRKRWTTSDLILKLE